MSQLRSPRIMFKTGQLGVSVCLCACECECVCVCVCVRACACVCLGVGGRCDVFNVGVDVTVFVWALFWL